MKDLAGIFALPTAILGILANSACAQELQWPYNLPRTVKYFPEHAPHMKRELEAQERLLRDAPIGMRKMSDDEGEKFFMHYWQFDGTVSQEQSSIQLANQSLPQHLLPATARHSNHDRMSVSLFRRNLFRRDFVCPDNTVSCSSVGESDLCCDNGQTCVNTSSGVGCCPEGQTCSDEISGCDTSAGYTSCPNSPNGGCCVPGAVCEGTGCIFYGTETVLTTLGTATETRGLTTETSSGRTVTVANPVPFTTTETVTVSPSGLTTTRTVVLSPSSTSCSDGFFTCPVSLGGGCCPNGQGCASGTSCLSISSPTSGVSVSVTPAAAPPPTAASSTTSAVYGCPTGFYACSAHYLGGCCRVGRNCETTSCPPADTATIVSSGVTVVASAPTSIRGGHCLNGWFSCGADVGGGCCPSNYECGQVTCTATDSGFSDTAKMAPSEASLVGFAWSFLMLGLFAGVGMVVL